MSSSIPPAKRRRIDTASETLKKPFRSPLVKRPQTGAEASSPVTPAPQRRAPDPTPTPSRTWSSRRTGPALRSAPVLQNNTTPSKTAPSKPPSSPEEDFTPEESALIATLRQRRKEAETKTREIEVQVELVRQAARIEKSSESNEKLEELVRKWKGACRLAAEELFELIRVRVDSMGGGDAWRETRRNQFWDDEDEVKREGVDEREEIEGREDDDRVEVEESVERDFTMHMMLKSLNIDPEVVGYDPVEDKWREWDDRSS